MIPALGVGMSAAAAAVVVAAGYATDEWLLAAAVAFLVLLLAVGWAELLELLSPRGTALLVIAAGVAGIAVAVSASATSVPLADFALLVAAAVLAAFAFQVLRRSREDLVESLTGALSGQVLALLAAGWLLVPGTAVGRGGLTTAAVAAVGVRLGGLLRLPPRLAPWAALGVGGLAGLVAAVLLVRSEPLIASSMALAVAATAAALDRLVSQQRIERLAPALLAASAAPVAASGMVAFAAVRLLGR